MACERVPVEAPPFAFPSCDRAVVCRNVAPVDFQKVAVQIATSTAAHAIYTIEDQCESQGIQHEGDTP